MRRYKTWRTGAGPVLAEVRPLGPAVLHVDFAIVSPGRVTPLERRNLGETAMFELDEAQVAALRGADGRTAAPYLAFLCDAFLGPQAIGPRRWGWAMRCRRGDAVLDALRADGTRLPADRDGFVRTALRPFPEHAGLARGYDIISFA